MAGTIFSALKLPKTIVWHYLNEFRYLPIKLTSLIVARADFTTCQITKPSDVIGQIV